MAGDDSDHDPTNVQGSMRGMREREEPAGGRQENG